MTPHSLLKNDGIFVEKSPRFSGDQSYSDTKRIHEPDISKIEKDEDSFPEIDQ